MQWFKRWPNFSPEEVLSPYALRTYNNNGIIGCDVFALDALQNLREEVGVPIKVNHNGLTLRGYRTPKEHVTIKGGAKMSPHCRGMAFDCTPVGMSLDDFLEAAKAQTPWMGFGLYRTFVHLDVWNRTGTDQRAFWSNK